MVDDEKLSGCSSQACFLDLSRAAALVDLTTSCCEGAVVMARRDVGRVNHPKRTCGIENGVVVECW